MQIMQTTKKPAFPYDGWEKRALNYFVTYVLGAACRTRDSFNINGLYVKVAIYRQIVLPTVEAMTSAIPVCYSGILLNESQGKA